MPVAVGTVVRTRSGVVPGLKGSSSMQWASRSDEAMPFPPEQLSPIDPRPLPDRESRLRTQVGMKDMQGAGDEAWNGTALPFCPSGDFTAASHTPWRPADSVGCALSSPAFDPPNGDPQHSQAT